MVAGRRFSWWPRVVRSRRTAASRWRSRGELEGQSSSHRRGARPKSEICAHALPGDRGRYPRTSSELHAQRAYGPRSDHSAPSQSPQGPPAHRRPYLIDAGSVHHRFHQLLGCIGCAVEIPCALQRVARGHQRPRPNRIGDGGAADKGHLDPPPGFVEMPTCEPCIYRPAREARERRRIVPVRAPTP